MTCILQLILKQYTCTAGIKNGWLEKLFTKSEGGPSSAPSKSAHGMTSKFECWRLKTIRGMRRDEGKNLFLFPENLNVEIRGKQK